MNIPALLLCVPDRRPSTRSQDLGEAARRRHHFVNRIDYMVITLKVGILGHQLVALAPGAFDRIARWVTDDVYVWVLVPDHGVTFGVSPYAVPVVELGDYEARPSQDLMVKGCFLCSCHATGCTSEPQLHAILPISSESTELLPFRLVESTVRQIVFGFIVRQRLRRKDRTRILRQPG